jgi:hypothetical protein
MKHLILAVAGSSSLLALRHSCLSVLIATLVLAASAGIATEVAAKGGAQLLPKSSLYTQVSTASTKAEIKAICAEIVARQDASSIGRRDASSLFMHGMIMGVSCLKVDYFKALVLARESGDAFTLKAALTYIRGRAEGGNTKAIRALEKYEKAYD